MKTLKKQPNEIRRLTLRGWAAIDDLNKGIESAAKRGEWILVSDLIYQTIDIGCENFDRNSFWMDAIEIYNRILQLNQPTKKFPILTSKSKSKPMPWEYEGRSWYFWLNLFAENYGWNEDQVASLEIDSAIGLYQEIEISAQLRDEWEWGLSEIAYEYNKSTKKSHFKPLPRPDWMKPIASKAEPVKKTKFPIAMMPAGVIEILDEDK